MQYLSQSARFSRCGNYRYLLSRCWDSSREVITFIGLNPSTADGSTDDPTLRRCVNFASHWGYGGLNMVNLFAFRATSPVDLQRALEPKGKRNDYWIGLSIRQTAKTVACWGNWGSHMQRDKVVRKRYSKLMCFGQTAKGQPLHPLYLPSSSSLRELY